MKNKYLNQLTILLKQSRPRLANMYQLEFKNVFGAVAGYINGSIFISCGRFGVALRLPPEILNDLFKQKGVRHLKYFPKGHIKKEYAVLSKRMLEDKRQFKVFITKSVKYALSSSEPS